MVNVMMRWIGVMVVCVLWTSTSAWAQQAIDVDDCNEDGPTCITSDNLYGTCLLAGPNGCPDPGDCNPIPTCQTTAGCIDPSTAEDFAVGAACTINGQQGTCKAHPQIADSTTCDLTAPPAAATDDGDDSTCSAARSSREAGGASAALGLLLLGLAGVRRRSARR